MSNHIITDTVSADTLEVSDQVIIDGDMLEIKDIQTTMDPDEVIVVGYSHETGDTVSYPLFADDFYDLWTV